MTIDRQCGSSQQAAHFAAALVMSGIHDLVVAGGVEVMSMVPLGSSLTAGAELGYGHAFGGTGWAARYGDQPISQFVGAELVAAQWDLGRPELEELALRSHRLAGEAQDDGRFVREIAPWNGFAADEGIRRGTTREQMAALEPLTDGGRVTAALASQISDGAAALLVASEDAITRHGLVPRRDSTP